MLAFIIVYYNHEEVLQDFLSSLKRNQTRNIKLFIADLSKNLNLSKNYGINFEITKGNNKGYSYGVNRCLKVAIKQGYNQFCVLNYDTYLDSQFVKKLNKQFATSHFFGGKIYYARGHEYHKKRYQQKDLGKVLWYAGGKINWAHATVTHRGVDKVDSGQYNQVEETGFIPGTLMAFTKKVVDKIGFWDERFFLYYEDTDYCVRAQKAGFKLTYNPKIILWHKNAGITDGAGSKLHIKHQAFSRLLFGLKHAPFRTKIHLIINFLVKN
jgi:GT2 family glycosyltransferase